MELATPVRREDHHRRPLGVKRTEFGNRHRRFTEEFEEQRFELVIGPVDLVDQQHRDHRSLVTNAREDRAFLQELLGEQVRVVDRRVARLREADGEQLTLVVPLVESLRGREAAVALQAEKRCPEHLGDGLGGRGLANPRLSFQQQGLAEGEREKQGGGEPFINQVVEGVQPRHQVQWALERPHEGTDPRGANSRS